MADKYQLDIITNASTQYWNQWRIDNPDVEIDLSDAVFFDKTIDGANLSRVNLRRANFQQAVLYDVDLSGADLTHANLTGAKIMSSNLQNVSLVSSVLSREIQFGDDIANTLFDDVDLRGADLTNIRAQLTNFEYVDFSGARLVSADLSHCTFFGSKVIDVDLSYADLSYASFEAPDDYLVESETSDDVDYVYEASEIQSAKDKDAEIVRVNLTGANITWTLFPKYFITDNPNRVV